MKAYFTLTIFACCFLTYCTTTKNVAAKKQDAPTYTYTADVAPILIHRCTPCHFPDTGRKLPLNTYTAVHDNIDAVIARVSLPHDDPKFMPFRNKKEPLSDSLIMVLKVWKEEGMAE